MVYEFSVQEQVDKFTPGGSHAKCVCGKRPLSSFCANWTHVSKSAIQSISTYQLDSVSDANLQHGVHLLDPGFPAKNIAFVLHQGNGCILLATSGTCSSDSSFS